MTRRLLVTLLTGLHAAFYVASAQAAPRELLTLGGPASVLSFPLFHMIESGALAAHARSLRFVPWSTGDQLRAQIVGGELDFAAVPSHLPANLYNRGQPVRLLLVAAWGVHWFVSRDPQVRRLDDLKGAELVVPLRQEMPGILIDELVQARGWTPGVELRVRGARDFPATVNMLLAGQARHALLAEPSVSLLMERNRAAGGAPLYRVQSIKQAWVQSFPKQPAVPQAGLMANHTVTGDAALLAAVTRAYAQSARWCRAEVAACARLAHRHLPQMPEAALREAIVSSPLESRPAAEIQPELDAFYRLLLARAPQLLGGRLPDAGLLGQ